MNASRVRRPTEDDAIGRTKAPTLWPPMWLYARQDQARRAGDMYLAHVLGHAAIRSLAGGKVGA